MKNAIIQYFEQWPTALVLYTSDLYFVKGIWSNGSCRARHGVELPLLDGLIMSLDQAGREDLWHTTDPVHLALCCTHNIYENPDTSQMG
jgi:hypothetical protein